MNKISIHRIDRVKYLAVLGIIFAILFATLAIDPHDRADWALENVLAILFILYLAATYRSFPLSRISYTLIFIFLCFHEVGAHYTYAEVPYDSFFRNYLGFSLDEWMGWERNHYDRLVHFSYGLLLAYPVREIYCRIASVEGFWAYFFPFDLVMASSMVFELFEWGAASYFGGDLGIAYLGTQGDVWDAQKDMALATTGALITMIITAGINWFIQDDFKQEWSDSLKIKQREPLGEDEIARLLKSRKK
ncbi:MAG: DUF2238 domain-containing protein [Balneolaceae bacterium]|nr:DUF2238 domain-containing protein [Balneolaceae bacterium]